MAARHKSKKAELGQSIISRYMDATGQDVIHMTKVAEWAIEQELWRVPRVSPVKLCARELSRAARLLLMAIIRFGTRFNRFTKAHPWLDKIEVNVEAAAESLCHQVEMELALCGHDRLAKFGVCQIVKRGIFVVQSGKSGRNFVFLAFGLG